jgi:DNA polymerase I
MSISKIDSKKVLLVDGSSLAFRMFFALERTGLTAPDGRPSWAVFGFLKALLEVIIKEKPSIILTAFDASGGTFRSEKFDFYKANRPDQMPEALAQQWPEIQRALRLIGLPVFEMKNWEADDILGTFSHQASQSGLEVLILSGDRDIFQLVSDKISALYPTNTGIQVFKTDDVQQKMGVRPDQIVDFKALSGDTSDNIAGVSGIGEKTAQKLLEKFDTLDNIYSNLGQVDSKSVRDKLEKDRQSAFDSQFLAKIRLDCPVDFDWAKNIEQHELQTDTEGLKKFVSDYKLNSLEKLLPAVFDVLGQNKDILENRVTVPKIDQSQHKITHELQNTVELTELQKVLIDLDSAQEIAVHIDFSDSVFELAFWKNKDTMIVLDYNFRGQIGFGWLEQIFIQINKFKKVYTHDYKELSRFLLQQKLVPFTALDVVLGAYLENSAQKFDWSDLVQTYLSDLDSVENLNQTLQTLILGQKIWDVSPEKIRELWTTQESPLAVVLAKMQNNGIYLDKAQLTLISAEMLAGMADLEIKIWEELGEQVNLNSTKQLGPILVKKGFKLGKTKGGSLSTDRSTLDKLLLVDNTDLIKNIIEHRTLAKLQSTYTENLISFIDSDDQRLHGEFKQTVAATGRLSSINPNLQNIPIKNADYGKLIRSCFAAETGNVILSADYSQIELRFLAHFSEDPVLIETFRLGQDVHSRTAAEIFEIPIEQINSAQRRLGKTLNFALVYQQGAFATAEMLDISQKQATEFIQKYFEKFPRVKPFVEEVLENARQNGFVETFWGRRRYFKNLKSSQVMLRKMEERAAFNAVLQGSNADLIKFAMLRIQSKLDTEFKTGKLILQVHDELLLETAVEDLEEVQKMVIVEMELDQPLRVPVLVEAGHGANWALSKG